MMISFYGYDNNKYMEKSDIIAETTNASGPKTTPIIANVNGNDNTPPPTTVDTKLNTDVFNVAVRTIFYVCMYIYIYFFFFLSFTMIYYNSICFLFYNPIQLNIYVFLKRFKT